MMRWLVRHVRLLPEDVGETNHCRRWVSVAQLSKAPRLLWISPHLCSSNPLKIIGSLAKLGEIFFFWSVITAFPRGNTYLFPFSHAKSCNTWSPPSLENTDSYSSRERQRLLFGRASLSMTKPGLSCKTTTACSPPSELRACLSDKHPHEEVSSSSQLFLGRRQMLILLLVISCHNISMTFYQMVLCFSPLLGQRFVRVQDRREG